MTTLSYNKKTEEWWQAECILETLNDTQTEQTLNRLDTRLNSHAIVTGLVNTLDQFAHNPQLMLLFGLGYEHKTVSVILLEFLSPSVDWKLVLIRKPAHGSKSLHCEADLTEVASQRHTLRRAICLPGNANHSLYSACPVPAKEEPFITAHLHPACPAFLSWKTCS